MMEMFREFINNIGDGNFNKTLPRSGGNNIGANPTSVAGIRFNSDVIRHNVAPASSATIPALMQPVTALVANPSSALMTMAGGSGGDVMPTMGNAIMGHIQAIQQNFGNKYNMQTQKEIADLQVRYSLFFIN
jgi:hypothetical protein